MRMYILEWKQNVKLQLSKVRIGSRLISHLVNLWKCPGMGVAGKGHLSGVQLDILAKQPWWLGEGGEDNPAFSCVFPPFLVCSSNQLEEDEVLWFLKAHPSVCLAAWLGSLQDQVNSCQAKGRGQKCKGMEESLQPAEVICSWVSLAAV